MHNEISVILTFPQVCGFKNKKMDTNFIGKLGVFFAPKTTFLLISVI